jgi:hypothetical protein
MKQITLALLFLLTLSACRNQPKVKTVTIKNQYSIEVPEPFTKIPELNGDASLEYGNLSDEFFVIVIDESKSEFEDVIQNGDKGATYQANLDDYTGIVIEGLKENMTNYKISSITDTVINTLPARLVNISGYTEGVDIYFQYCFIEGRAHFYQVMTWTTPSRKHRYINAMNKMLRSLKEL